MVFVPRHVFFPGKLCSTLSERTHTGTLEFLLSSGGGRGVCVGGGERGVGCSSFVVFCTVAYRFDRFCPISMLLAFYS